MTATQKPWELKAHRVIASLCHASWYEANHIRGKKKRTHVPYRVPQDAETLVKCLADGDEVTAKHVFQRHAFGAINK